jgi:TetR/AcrR family tetracycline transcriptional repressor
LISDKVPSDAYARNVNQNDRLKDPAPLTKSGRPRLDRDQVVRAAVQLLDEEGLDGLTTRRLAAKLGVQSPALYWHVRNKDELLDLVAEELCAPAADFQPDPGLSWQERIQAGLWEFRRLLLAHRDTARVLSQRPPTGPNRLRLADRTVRELLDAGFSEADAAALTVMLASFVPGMVDASSPTGPGRIASAPHAAPQATTEEGTWERSSEIFASRLTEQLASYPALARVAPHFGAADPEAQFALAVRVLLDGLQQRLTTT